MPSYFPPPPFQRVALTLAAALTLVAAPPVSAQDQAVAGTVRRAGTLVPIEGASVQIAGTTLSALTDAAGRFRITGVTGDSVTIQVRRLSYDAVSQRVAANATDIRVLLGENAVRLDEVIVTGTAVGTQSRALGNSITSLNAVDEVEKSGVGDVGALLNARAPGVIVTSGSGRTGSGPSINVRGRNTISLSQQPLLYIDGVRVTNDIGTGTRFQGGSPASRLNDVSPEDIESIEILKGPAAATIYGTEAANGVIQIITRKGRLGAAPQGSVTLRQGTQWFSDAAGRIATNYSACSAAAVLPTSNATACHNLAAGSIVTWNAVEQEDARGTPIWKNGRMQTWGTSLSGGQQAVRYYVSGTFDHDQGIEPNNFGKLFTGHANLSVAASDKLDVNTSMNLVRGLTHLGTEFGASTFFAAQYGSALTVGSPFRGFLLFPPEMVWALWDNTQDLSRFTSSVQLNHRPIGWLSQRLTVGLDQTTEDNQGLQRFAPDQFRPLLTPVAARGQIFQDVRNLTYYTADYGGTATFNMTPSVSSATSIGGQFYERRLATSQATGTEFPAPGLSTVQAAAIRSGSQDFRANTTIGLYVQEQVGWNDRLFLTGAVRVDNNSAFGEDFDFVTYPKVSASWVISEESFWSPARQFVQTLKLRSAFGQSGQQPETFTALQTYAPVTGTQDQPAVTPLDIGNSTLKPERGAEFEVGFEAGLFDRLSLDVTYFSRRTKDAILSRPNAPSSGFGGNQFVNIGEVTNKGVEVLGRVQAINRERLGLELGINVGTASDKISDLGGIPFIATGLPTQRHVEGHPIGGFWTKRVTNATVTGTGPTATLTNVMCDNGAGGEAPCATAPVVFLGTPTPKMAGAFTSTLSLGENLRFFALLDFKRGHKLLAADTYNRCAAFGLCEVNVRPEAYSPQYVANVRLGGALVIADQFVQDASYTKLREVSATYTLPGRFARYTRMDRASITLAGRNLHTWTKFGGLDPDSRSQIASIVQFDQATMPSLAQFVATLNFTF